MKGLASLTERAPALSTRDKCVNRKSNDKADKVRNQELTYLNLPKQNEGKTYY